MTRPVFEPNLERTDAALGYDKAQLQRRPAQTGSGAIQWVRLVSNTTQTFPALDQNGIVYVDSVTNNYPGIFDVGLSAGDSFSVLLLVTGLYEATVRVNVGSPEPAGGFSLELKGTDYVEGLQGYHSVYYPGYTTGGTYPPPEDGLPFTAAVWEKNSHTFMGNEEFIDNTPWSIQSSITTAGDAVDILAATMEVRRLGDVDFFPYSGSS